MAAPDPSCPPFPLLVPEDDEPHHHHHDGHQHQEGGPETMELPVVDLEAPGEALPAACRRLGVFRLANHGVPGELSARLFALARDLLGRAPFREKQAWPGYFWGTPAITLQVKEVNWVEGFHVALGNQHERAEDAGPAFSEFRAVADEYGEHMARVARTLFTALAPTLHLDAEQTSTYLAERDGTLRVYRYPPCPRPSSSSRRPLGMEPHTDSSVLSVINQQHQAADGLQVLHDDGRWRDVVLPGGDGSLLVNLGDMAQAISGDAFRSVRHRVVASRPESERFSLCYFAFPRDDAVLRCPGGRSRYRPFCYKEFREQVQEDIRDTGAKVGLERFLLPSP